MPINQCECGAPTRGSRCRKCRARDRHDAAMLARPISGPDLLARLAAGESMAAIGRELGISRQRVHVWAKQARIAHANQRARELVMRKVRE